jgi:hypothetical protein
MNSSRFSSLVLSLAAVCSLSAIPTAGQTPAPARTPITVYKSATCGCCANWNDHLRANGFAVTSHDLPDVNVVKDKHGVPQTLRSCHTALVGRYVVEGHVPADLIRKLMRERPAVAGLAVPGMPMGSHGMEGPRTDRYQVLTFDKAGETTVFATR